MQKRYNDYGNWIRNKFGTKVQKISLDGGFSCPNRDGRISHGGCVYCNNATFNPSYCTTTAGRKSEEESLEISAENILEQLIKGKSFFAKKYPEMKYIAYFQSYTNTYAPLHQLKTLYETAASAEDIVGISIATRPDCISDELLDYLENLSKRTFLTVEYGVESLNDDTLKKINRGHNSACSIKAIESTHNRGITTCAHIILGLPGETTQEILRQADILCHLPVDIIKLHQLQITKNTILSNDEELKKECTLYTPDEYISIITEYIKHARKDIVFERFTSQSPSELLIAPRWGLKNHEFTNLLDRHLASSDVWQGTCFYDS